MIGTIEEELKLCEEAFEGVEVGALVWLCHHEVLIEILSEPAINRIKYIMTQKPEDERTVRLHEFRPVKGKIPDRLNKAHAEVIKARTELNKAYAEWNKAYVEWNKASVKRDKVCAEWDEACAKWDKVCAEWKPYLEALHLAENPDTTWNGKTIVF